MRAFLIVLLLAGVAHADDTRRAMFGDSAAVATLRPLALGATLQRLGSGWDALVRQSLPLPAAVNPFDATVLSTTGIDPSGVAWFCARALRGGLHLRAALPLIEPRVAEALMQTASGWLGGQVQRGADKAWTARLQDGTPLVARLDGNALVIDVVLAGATMVPTPQDVERVVPLHPPRAFAGTRGTQKRMSVSDAAAVWVDLQGVAKLGLDRGEHEFTAALKGVDPAQRQKLVRQARGELGKCKMSLNATPHSFDDLLVAINVVNPEQVRLEFASSGHRSAVDALRALRATLVPTHELADKSEADVRFALTAPPIPKVGVAKHNVEQACPAVDALAEMLWGWPTMLTSSDLPEWARVLSGLRAFVGTVPLGDKDAAGVTERQFAAVAEIDPAIRAGLDSLLTHNHFDATTPLRVGARSLTAWTPPSYGAESMIVAVDPGATSSTGTVVAMGARDLLRPTLEHVVPSRGVATGPIGTLTFSSHGLQRVMRQFGAAGATPMVDGITQLDASLVLDEDVLHLDTDFTLKPR